MSFLKKPRNNFTYLRVFFGIVWAIDAAMAWQPAFLGNFESYLTNAAQNTPVFCAGWIYIWIWVTSGNPYAFAFAVAVISTALAVCLIFGIFPKTTLWVGMIFSALIWTTTGFGGPYMAGSTDIGSSIIYVFVFAALLFGLGNNPAASEKISAIPESKKATYIKILSLVAIVLFAALVAPYLVDNSGNQTSGSMSTDMMQKTFDIPAGTPVPTVSFKLTKDALDGYDLYATTTNFTFTPQLINQAPVADEGHIHLYVDGTLYVVFGNWYHIPGAELPPGKHVVTVSLNANDHSVFWANGQTIQDTQTIDTY